MQNVKISKKPIWEFMRAKDTGKIFQAIIHDIKGSEPDKKIKLKHKPLKPCPCCGGETVIRARQTVTLLGVSAVCRKCGLSVGQFEGTNVLGKYTSFEGALNDVINKWNKRA